MPKSPIPNDLRINLSELRSQEFSYKEIAKIKGVSTATAFRYSRQVSLGRTALDRLALRRFPSRAKAIKQWQQAGVEAKTLFFPKISEENMPLILTCLHWCEGNKGELSFINSDPSMVKIYIKGLQSIGVGLEQMRFTLRSYSGHDDGELVSFWSNFLGISKGWFGKIDHIKGNKQGKLQYGMCRVRVLKGAYYFKLIMSMIELVKKIHTLP